MAVGFTADKTAINARAGDLARRVRDLLTDIERMQDWLESQDDADLAAVGYSPEDIVLLKAAFVDLDSLRQVAEGLQVGPTALNNFLFHSNKLLGVN
jgi:hypothetical protein